MKRTLSKSLEYAILQILMGSTSTHGAHEDFWGEWEKRVHNHIPDHFTQDDLKDAFKRLHTKEVLRLTKGYPAQPYSGNEEDDPVFFFSGSFAAKITPEGRSHWDELRVEKVRHGLFISHITEEGPVALVLQKYLRLAFGNDFPVFVSSDAKSIGGGTKWYTEIIDSLRSSEVVLVLVSQESRGRTWINFEAGVGEGAESLVIPVGIAHFPLGQLSFPLLGIQARNIDEIGSILEDIEGRIGKTANTVSVSAYHEELQEAEAALIFYVAHPPATTARA
ncbi:MAG: toll/interleukin-1 receptor domain-containing protein [Bryobacteraceae bacterium]